MQLLLLHRCSICIYMLYLCHNDCIAFPGSHVHAYNVCLAIYKYYYYYRLPLQSYNVHVHAIEAGLCCNFALLSYSVESLQAELKDYFNMLVVFDYDTLIPSRALETIWGTDFVDTDNYIGGRLSTNTYYT